jgi:uncharacterized protein with PQ loop repeat
MMPWKNPSFVQKTPLISVFLLEWANLSQLIRMWTEWSSEGQSLMGWITVNIALWIWLNFYNVITPEARYAIWGTRFGILMNSAVIFSVIFFRYIL